MRSLIFHIIILIILILPSLPVQSQKLEYIKVPELEKILKNNDNKLFVINFWASWCAPCVREYPYFTKVSGEYDPAKVEFIMISLDFPSQIENALMPFLKKNKGPLKVAVMMDVDYNSWIDKVDTSWQGDIPATLIFNNAKKMRHFRPGELDESRLRKMINELL